jgi:hypothetical protein
MGGIVNEGLRQRLDRILVDQVTSARYPSVSAMDRVEQTISDPRAALRYVTSLLEIVERDRFSSPTLMERLSRLITTLEATAG